MTDIYGGIEAGGTRFVCIVGSGHDDIRAEGPVVIGAIGRYYLLVII